MISPSWSIQAVCPYGEPSGHRQACGRALVGWRHAMPWAIHRVFWALMQKPISLTRPRTNYCSTCFEIDAVHLCSKRVRYLVLVGWMVLQLGSFCAAHGFVVQRCYAVLAGEGYREDHPCCSHLAIYLNRSALSKLRQCTLHHPCFTLNLEQHLQFVYEGTQVEFRFRHLKFGDFGEGTNDVVDHCSCCMRTAGCGARCHQRSECRRSKTLQAGLVILMAIRKCFSQVVLWQHGNT
jgi:hypothetical protein